MNAGGSGDQYDGGAGRDGGSNKSKSNSITGVPGNRMTRSRANQGKRKREHELCEKHNNLDSYSRSVARSGSRLFR